MLNKNQICYGVTGGLSKSQLQIMHEQALDILEHVGMAVPHQKTLKRLAENSGVSINGNRVFYKPEVVNAATKGISFPKGESFEVLSGAYSMNILDFNGDIRTPTEKDLVEMVRLADSMGMNIIAPVTPLDLPVELQQIAMFKLVWENSQYGIGGGLLTDKEQADYVYRMAQIVGKTFSLGLWVISPLTLDANCLDIIHHFLDRNVETWVATMPMAGSTSPIFFIGAYVQSIAETLGAATTLKLMSRGKVSYGFKDSFRAYPFDMQYGTIAYGSPEYVLMSLIQMQLADYYGIPRVAKSLITTAKAADTHAAAEKMGHTMAAMLAGAQSFSNAGMLSVDEIFSPAQLVIDQEILQYVKRVLKGYEFSQETLCAGIIKETVQNEQDFIQHESTLNKFRDLLWRPQLFEHKMLGQWRSEDMKSTADRANEIAIEMLSKWEHHLTDDIRQELNNVWDHAVDHLQPSLR
jgi:trimethylamine---corrinoid protein Co-methyltransferase